MHNHTEKDQLHYIQLHIIHTQNYGIKYVKIFSEFRGHKTDNIQKFVETAQPQNLLLPYRKTLVLRRQPWGDWGGGKNNSIVDKQTTKIAECEESTT